MTDILFSLQDHNVIARIQQNFWDDDLIPGCLWPEGDEICACEGSEPTMHDPIYVQREVSQSRSEKVWASVLAVFWFGVLMFVIEAVRCMAHRL